MPILKEIGSGLGTVFAGLALIATVFGVYMLFTLWDSATHGDRENREQASAAALSCPQKKVRISGNRAEGCGRACALSTTGSSASWLSAYVCNLDPSAKP